MPDKTILLYGNTVKIEFFEEWINPRTKRKNTHAYLVNDRKCEISVTGVTGMLNKPALVEWAVRMAIDYIIENGHLPNDHRSVDGIIVTRGILEEARKAHANKKTREATSGSLVHDWAERYIKGENPDIPDDPRVLNGVNAFLAWEAEKKPKFLWSEKIVYSKKYKYVGIMDCAFTLASEKHKIIHAGDFKTSSGIFNEMMYQVSAYQQADMEESGREYGSKWILRFDKDTGEFEAKEFLAEEHEDDFKAFAGLLAVKKRELEIASK